jgi:hypothetical protein
MAKKSKKKSDSKDLQEVVDRLLEDVGDDRDSVKTFLDGLIANYPGDQSVGIAEYVAKLADALTRQHQVRASAVKALAKSLPEDDGEDDLDEINRTIGLPFKSEAVDDGSN